VLISTGLSHDVGNLMKIYELLLPFHCSYFSEVCLIINDTPLLKKGIILTKYLLFSSSN
jgi:hypothetical protein